MTDLSSVVCKQWRFIWLLQQNPTLCFPILSNRVCIFDFISLLYSVWTVQEQISVYFLVLQNPRYPLLTRLLSATQFLHKHSILSVRVTSVCKSSLKAGHEPMKLCRLYARWNTRHVTFKLKPNSSNGYHFIRIMKMTGSKNIENDIISPCTCI